MRIEYDVDSVLLQTNLNRLISWGESLNLQPNVAKCQIMIFLRCQNDYGLVYMIRGTPIPCVDFSIRNLSFRFSKNQSPRMHIEKICCYENKKYFNY